jgi:membrane associated rhomboid family serine protease
MGLTRPPVATLLVLAVTAAMSVTQWLSPGLLGRLERTPAELHGQPWRILTSLFVQDGGLVGTISNLAFLLVLGTAAEQFVSGRRLFLAYFGVGAVSELVGYLWQPVGGGNSVAVCGLAGVLAVAMWRNDPRLPAFTEPATLLWCAAVLGTVSNRLYLAFVVAGVFAVRFQTRFRSRGLSTSRAVAAVVVLSTAVLVVLHNIHGGALLVGLALGAGMHPAAARNDQSRMDPAK